MAAVVQNNNYCLSPASFSGWVATHEVGNWGDFLGPSFAVTLDPQISPDVADHWLLMGDPDVELRSEDLKRQIRRRLMSEITSEFSALNEGLLRELAR